MNAIHLLVLVVLTAPAQAQPDTALTNTLAKLVLLDQQAAGLPPTGVLISSPTWLKFKDSVFTANYQAVKKLFDTKGFPGYDQVGQAGSHHFYLLVQHSDKWPLFQEQVLQAMDRQVKLQNASASDYAYLTDRVRLNTGQRQVYGTQLTYNTDSCQAVPINLESPATANERRKTVELDRLEVYLNQMSESHYQMNKAFYEKKRIYRPKLYGDQGKRIQQL